MNWILICAEIFGIALLVTCFVRYVIDPIMEKYNEE